MAEKYLLTLKQDEAFEHLTSQEDCSILFGGAKGGGKSYLLCLWVFYWAKYLIKFFDIIKIDFPLPVGFIGRKRGVDFEKTTLETWKRIIPSSAYVIHDQAKEIIIENKVKIFFGGLDDQNVINKFNSAEFAFFALDQAEETERGEVSILQASLRLKHNNKQPPFKTFYTANPAECWLKEDFITNKKDASYYIPALPIDNPYLPDNYLKTLDDAFGYDTTLLAAYKHGDWDVLQPRQALITQASLNELPRIPNKESIKRRIVACDPSLGGDECVVYYMEDYEIKDQLFLHSNDTQQIGNDVCIFMTKHKCDDFVVDAIGIGKGVADYVRSSGKKVQEIISSASPLDKIHFSNLRSEIWGYLSELVRQKVIVYPVDEKLRQQLCAVKYKTGAKKFELEKKENTKRLLGCSPDRADTFAYGVWGLSNTIYTKSDKPEFSISNYNPLAAYQPAAAEFVQSGYKVI